MLGFHLTFSLMESQLQFYLMRYCGFIPQPRDLAKEAANSSSNKVGFFEHVFHELVFTTLSLSQPPLKASSEKNNRLKEAKSCQERPLDGILYVTFFCGSIWHIDEVRLFFGHRDSIPIVPNTKPIDGQNLNLRWKIVRDCALR